MATTKPLVLDSSNMHRAAKAGDTLAYTTTGSTTAMQKGDGQGGLTDAGSSDFASPTDLSQVPRAWQNGTRRVGVREVCASATVSSGVATFYLTDTGAAGGNALFGTAVFKESANFWVESTAIQYQYGNYTLSGDRKTLTVNVTQLGSVLLGIIQFVAAANGATVYLRICGY